MNRGRNDGTSSWCLNTERKATPMTGLKIFMSLPALKKAFAENEEIQEMAQDNFIMLNLMHETTDKNLSPDGQYVPRIMFIGMYCTYESSEDVISASIPVSFSRNIKTNHFAKRK
ncbi:hypothetical protein CIB84_012729 [Bambusicola thoracicus]|uniref:Uncharacterized protein n=1 Tax=Bambusicola thoracicus TaxID=9083 RepID=A0A2P4SHH2_BAMTH|nr:hypothetical protein CIB84_012729 [Bambusicola thoracicus]